MPTCITCAAIFYPTLQYLVFTEEEGFNQMEHLYVAIFGERLNNRLKTCLVRRTLSEHECNLRLLELRG